jgi:hypothetical protein
MKRFLRPTRVIHSSPVGIAFNFLCGGPNKISQAPCHNGNFETPEARMPTAATP